MASIERERVRARFTEMERYGVTLVVAPSGFGKSVALDEYLRAVPGEVVRFNVGRAHGSLTRFVRALAAALEPSLPRVAQSLAIAHERATQSPKPSDVLATWLAEHLGNEPRTLVVDDLHHCEGERNIAAFLGSAIERTRKSVRWIIACRSSADLPVAMWLARGDTGLPIDEKTLRLTIDEARRYARTCASELDDLTVLRLFECSDGAPATFMFGAHTIAQRPEACEHLLCAGGDAFGRFADDVFARCTAAEQALLLQQAVFPDVDETILSSESDDAASLLALAERTPQMFDHRSGRRQFHDLFLGSLRARLKALGSDAVRDATMHAASRLEAAGRIGDALALYMRERRDVDLIRVIEAHGFAFLEAGHGESIHEAIDALDPLARVTSSVVLAIKAMSESTSGRFDTAESWFQLALDRAADPLRAQVAYQYGSHLLRFFRREAVGVLEELAADRSLPENLRAYVLAALGPAYVFERRIADARRVTDDALALGKVLGIPHVTARTHHQAAFVALYENDARRANELASLALACADEHGFFDVAAGALSVLYNVAADIEDDPFESVRLLETMGDCAAKSGSLTNQLISLVAALEIEIERDNEDVAERIDEKLSSLDVSFAGRTMYEALLPTQALRASWTGDFLGAYRLLANSADQQWSPDRKALRSGEIAVYAAAAGRERDAVEAIAAAGEITNEADVDQRLQRARLFAALANVILGRTEAAAEELARIDASAQLLSRRLAALRRTIGALHARYRGAANHNEVLVALAELRACGFGGFARLITMLPMADNAAHRANRLSVAERQVALRFAGGEVSSVDERVQTIARKLGCGHAENIRRAVAWHRASFERSGARTATSEVRA